MTDHLNPPRDPATISRAELREVLAMVEDMDLPDGAHWAMCHDMLGLDYGELFPLIAEYEL